MRRSEGADVRLERDLLGRIVRESQDGGATWVSSRFGLDGSRALVESTLGARQRVETDTLGLVSALHHGAPDGFPIRTEHDELGDEARRSYPGGIAVEWQRDLAGRPTQRRTLRHRTGHGEDVGAGTAGRDHVQELDALVYQWRGDDQIAALLDAEHGPRVFDHDRRGRLVRERRPDRVVERAMDAVGNVYRRADGQDRRYGRGGLLEAANDERGAVTFTHDADGNRTTKHEPDGTHWTYRWNGHGFLAEVERRSDVTDAARAARLEPDLHLRFTYDAFARRVAKRVEADGEVRETRFVWDGHTVLHELRSVHQDEATRDALGLQRACLDTLALAPATLETGDEPELTTWYWDPGTFTPIAKERAGRRWSVTSDHLGTPTEMYDELGELAWRMQLDVFGVPTFEEGTAEDCPWRWPGQYDDVETGEFYNRWRYYDPESGRYTSLDPARLAGGSKAFAYVGDPSLWLDPWGLSETFLFRGVHAQHPALADARRGVVQPAAPSSLVTATAHNTGGVSGASRFTSWTRSPGWALYYAEHRGPGGVVLYVPAEAPPPGAAWFWELSDDLYFEEEVLLDGPRDGVSVSTPEEFRQQFGSRGGPCRA